MGIVVVKVCKMFLVVILASLALSCHAAPTELTSEIIRSVCSEELVSSGLSKFYARNVAHRLHSITVDDINKHFAVQVGEDNTIPTVNKNLEGDKRVLSFAPRSNLDQGFTTDAVQYLDMILKDMDRKGYSITNFSVLEKLAHVFHMAEIWSHAGVHYQSLLLNPPRAETCACAVNPDTVLQELNLLALKIKYPGVTSGQYEELKEQENLGYDVDYSYGAQDAPPGYDVHYSYGKTADVSDSYMEKLYSFDFTGEESEVVERVSRDLVDGDTGMAKHLDSAEGWAYWKGKMVEMEEIGNYEFAVYMYCKLH